MITPKTSTVNRKWVFTPTPLKDEAQDIRNFGGLAKCLEYATPSRGFRKSFYKRETSILNDEDLFNSFSLEGTCMELEEIRPKALFKPENTTTKTDYIYMKYFDESAFAKSPIKPTQKILQTKKIRKAKEAKLSSLKTEKRFKTSSKYLGVCWNKNNQKWQAQVYLPRSDDNPKPRYKYLGLYSSEKKAAKEYDTQMLLLNTSVSDERLNFPKQKC